MVTIIVNPLPAITATPPSTAICIGSSVTITAAGGNSYAWAPGNFTTATVTVTPPVTTTYTVTGTDVNGCINTASATVTVNPLPSVTASASTSSICIGSSTTLSAGGAQSYVWSPGNQSGSTITVSPTSTTTYTVTGTDANGCVNTGTVQITVNPLPAVTAAASIPAICIGGSTTLTASGASTYAWLPGNLSGSSVTVSPTATTTYTVTGTSSAGCVSTSIITVTVSTLPNVLANTTDPNICSGESTLLTASGATTYAWSPGNQTGASISVAPSASTTYTVIGTSSAGCLDTATISITVNTVPIINLNPQSITICEGFSAGVDAGLDTNNYSWSPSIGVNIITGSGDSVVVNPSASTIYTVISTSPQGCSDTATISVIVNPNPILALSMDTLILCPTQTDTISVSGASTYSWSSNSNWSPLTTNNSSVSIGPVSSSATYTVVGTSAAGCSDTLVLYSEMQNVIAVNAYSDTTVCSGSTVTLNATGGNQYSWTSTSSSTIVNGNAASPSVTVTNTSVFVVSVINQNGCFGSDSVTITALALPPADAGLDDTICFGQSTVLNGSGGNSYVWMGSSIVSGSNTATPTVAPSSTSNYYMSVVDANGCQNSDTVTVTVIQLPIAAAGPDLFYCGTCVTMSGSGGTSYSWSPPAGLTNPTAAVTQACPLTTTTYTLTVTDNYGCSSQDSALVTVYPPLQLQVSPAITICNGSGTTISGIASGGDGGPYTYSWSPSTGLNNAAIANPTASPTVTTTYVLTVSDQCGSPVVSDSIVVTVYSSPTLSLSADIVEGCAPLCVNFVGASTPSASICNIDFGDLTNAASCAASHCYDDAGTYSITFSVTDMNGCVTTQTYANMIVVHPIPVAGFTASPDTASILSPMFYFDPNCTFCDTTIYSMGDPSGGIVSNLNQPFNYSYQDTGWYTVVQSVISEHGCVASDSINIYVKPDWSFYAPNAFTPNEDGINEVFFVSGTGIDPETFNLYIFDRWGNLIFFTDDINQGWNGRVLGGEICQIDTYVWKCDFVNVLGNKQSVMGSVNLIK
jgi:gliding motility-associated-like protein